MIILDIVNSRFSTDPLTDIFTISPILGWKSCQAFLLAAVGHLIFLNAVRLSVTSAWRDWTLWCASQLCTSCVSPGETPTRCVWVFSTLHFILAWWIFKPRIFLGGCPRGVMVKAMDCRIVESEFELHSRYYTFGQIPLGKVWIPLSSHLWVK